MRTRLLIIALFIVMSLTRAHAEFRFSAGIDYAAGFDSVISAHRENRSYEGYGSSKSSFWPVGASFASWYLFQNGFAAGVKAGPAAVITGSSELWLVPVTFDTRYYYQINDGFSLYGRGGICVPVAGGTYVKGTMPGPVAALGCEIHGIGPLDLSCEISVNGSSLRYRNISTDSVKTLYPEMFCAGVSVIL